LDVLVLDCETTTHNKGHFADPRNSLVCVAYDDICVYPTVEELAKLQRRIDACKVIVGFNIKFDLHWLRKYGIRFGHKRIEDVQIAEYMLSYQTIAYPSLNDTAEKWLGERKHDKIAEYWDQGLQTTEIPQDELFAYAIQDVALTRKLHEVMKVPESQRKLYSLCCQDLLVLEEMEWNGMKYNRERSLVEADKLEKEINVLQAKHFKSHNIPGFNWGSPDQMAALLFGGVIVKTEKEPCGFYKSGKKKGEVKYQNVDREYHLPRRYKPIKKSDAGKWSTDEDTLLKLGGDELVTDLLTIRKMEKEISTYLRGLPKLQDKMFYGHEMIYGTFNQCRTGTGRLSSTKPNLQNMSDAALQCFESRY
jgi:DNA polymerase-1